MGKPGKIFKMMSSPTLWGNLVAIHERIEEETVEMDKVKGEFSNCNKLTSHLDANADALTSILSVHDKMIKTLSQNVLDNATSLKKSKTGSTSGSIGSLMAGIGVAPSSYGIPITDFEN